jgi:hypothetical protein
MGSSLPSGKESGRGTITNAILGLILALGAYLIIFTINPNLLNFCLDQQLPTVDILINGESTINPEPISTTEIIKTTGINCPGSGGISQLSPISKSFIEHVTYNKSKRNKRDSSTLYFDCSSFVSQVYSCAGLTRPGNNTNDMFTNGNKDTNVSGIKAGDLLGWKKGESSKYPKSGHVFMSLGGDSIIEVSNPPGGVNTNAHIASLNHYASEVKHIIRIK